jgi:hypothetical protein
MEETMAQQSGGGTSHVLYGVWIDEALKKNDVNEMRTVLQEVRKHWGGIQPLYGVYINHAIQSGASRQELQGLLDHAKATHGSDLPAAIKKLEEHLGKKS